MQCRRVQGGAGQGVHMPKHQERAVASAGRQVAPHPTPPHPTPPHPTPPHPTPPHPTPPHPTPPHPNPPNRTPCHPTAPPVTARHTTPHHDTPPHTTPHHTTPHHHTTPPQPHTHTHTHTQTKGVHAKVRLFSVTVKMLQVKVGDRGKGLVEPGYRSWQMHVHMNFVLPAVGCCTTGGTRRTRGGYTLCQGGGYERGGLSLCRCVSVCVCVCVCLCLCVCVCDGHVAFCLSVSCLCFCGWVVTPNTGCNLFWAVMNTHSSMGVLLGLLIGATQRVEQVKGQE